MNEWKNYILHNWGIFSLTKSITIHEQNFSFDEKTKGLEYLAKNLKVSKKQRKNKIILLLSFLIMNINK